MKRLLRSIAGLALGAAIFPCDPACAGPGGAVFTHPPTDIANAAGVVPLGNLNPGGGHVLAVDHMYVRYPHPDNGGADVFPVYAMADGEIVAILRQQVLARPDFDYQVFIRHDRHVSYYFDHLHGLSGRVMDLLASVPDSAWITPPGANFRIAFFGQLGAPAPLPVAAGEQVGVTKSYSFSWDVGAVDARVHRHFAGHGPRRYPDFQDFLKLFGYKIDAPFAGNKTKNAVCFLDYMTPALKAAWFPLLVSTPKSCGSDAWDVDGRLRGAWFNPAVDAAAEPPLFELERAALSIIPDNLAPGTRIQVGVGTGSALYSAFDPAGVIPQLREPLRADVDFTPGARVNPDPATVGQATGTVCYDLSYHDFGGTLYNTMLFRMLGGRRVAIKYDPAPHASSRCASLPLAEPDASWITYVR
jgi:hypothetical protein